MKIRLGYACQTMTLDITCSKTTTYTNYIKYNDLSKIDELIKINLSNLEYILKYNIKNDIKFFRLSSQIIPLATKDDVIFDYIQPYKDYYEKISLLSNKLRLDFHPDQFTVINSVKKEVVENAIFNLEYHYKLLKAFNIKNKLLIIHVGSSVFGKEASIKRFIKNFKTLPVHLQKCIGIENDDKVYNIEDCLLISKILNIPVILDYHHHICNHNEFNIDKFLPQIFDTWQDNIPKMHYSSPKSKLKKEFRTHHDFINYEQFASFLNILKKYNKDVDIMLEAKAKDEALFRLIRQLKYLNYDINGTTINL